MNTLLLDCATWDLCSDAAGNIAVASDPYSMAQDVASACRLFLGELWYDTTQGIPYFDEILGTSPPTSFIQAQLVNSALTVPGVVEATAVSLSFIDGVYTGQVQFSDVSGTLATATFSGILQAEAPGYAGTYALLDVSFILDQSLLS